MALYLDEQPDWVAQALDRIAPQLEALFLQQKQSALYPTFLQRLHLHFGALCESLSALYGERKDFHFHLQRLVLMAGEYWLRRPQRMLELDRRRSQNQHWFRTENMAGAVCYVDLFAGTFDGLRAKIPYFKELGITYLHLMPLFKAPEGENDGGYAVSDYRQSDSKLGSFDDLSLLADELRKNEISLVVDFVNNHTSDEHPWAIRAKKGDPYYQAFYYTFPNRTIPDEFDRVVREIFPDTRRGSFTFNEEMQRWVWTTFHSYQWDLNYRNPDVLMAMAGEMLFLANSGVEVLRMDAVAFTWKAFGTNCENEPQAHSILRVMNALARLAAPSLLFKSEAIVHPDEVVKYIDEKECQLSYNPLLMALLWESLATRKTELLQKSMMRRFQISPNCAWINYVRCHDDIGWTFDDGDAWKLGINGYDHRQFLNSFYVGSFEGSFSAGLPFQFNPDTGDMRISGMCASLAGLEKALRQSDAQTVEHALRRILLIHGVCFSIGGIPLIYIGDELGMMNDYGYKEIPEKANDSRWIHRPLFDWEKAENRTKNGSLEQRLFSGMQRMFSVRKAFKEFGIGQTQIVESSQTHLFIFRRSLGKEQSAMLFNFSEHEIMLSVQEVNEVGILGMHRELLSDQAYSLEAGLRVEPYGQYWFKRG